MGDMHLEKEELSDCKLIFILEEVKTNKVYQPVFGRSNQINSG